MHWLISLFAIVGSLTLMGQSCNGDGSGGGGTTGVAGMGGDAGMGGAGATGGSGGMGIGGTGGVDPFACGADTECDPEFPSPCGTLCQDICGGFENFDTAGCGEDNRCFCSCVEGICSE